MHFAESSDKKTAECKNKLRFGQGAIHAAGLAKDGFTSIQGR
jgi:hypothetical protein